MPNLKLAKLNGKPEIFHTLQGEGFSVGVPAVFIRSSLCNLHCSWCDTDYTWNWKNTPWKHQNDSLEGYEKFDKSEYIVELDTVDIADTILQYNCPRLILTGGEPLLQQEAWIDLLKILRQKNPAFVFEVETNGTISPTTAFTEFIHQFNVSPKLSNSENSETSRHKEHALKYFSNHKNAWFKFVIAAETDLTEINTIIDNYSIHKDRVILMAEGRTLEALDQRRIWVAEACKSHGYRFGDRLHIRLWGEKRGV